MVAAFAAAAALGLSCAADAAPLSDFVEFNYDFQNDGFTGGDLKGRLFVPDDYDPSKSYDMIIHLHGAGERGTDNTSHVTTWNLTGLWWRAKTEGVLLYAPQTSSWWGKSQVDLAMRGAATVADAYNVNRSGVYVTGLSMGGEGTWRAMYEYGDALAAGVPICGVLPADRSPERLVDRPVWAFHGRGDTVVPVSATRTQVNEIRAAQGLSPWTFGPSGSPTTLYQEGTLRYTEIDTAGHNTWEEAYNELAMYEWMFAQETPNTRMTHGQTLAFDLGATVLPGELGTDGNVWNSTTYGLEKTLGASVAFAKDTQGKRHGVNLSVVDGFNGRFTNGVTQGTTLDAEVASDSWTVGSWSGHSVAKDERGELKLTGLEPGAMYEVKLFGSYAGGDGGRSLIAKYVIGEETRLLDTNDNADEWAVFESVQASGSGQILISVMVAEDGSTRWAPVNALMVTQVPEPGTAGVMGVLVGLCALRRRR